MREMRSLPSGTATFLFTDIEGSTQLLHALGPEYRDVLARHFAILRVALEAHDGVEVNTEGDALFAVFPDASNAVAAAAEMQRGLAETDWPRPLKVRMGIHTGAATLSGRDYVGMDVNRAARVANTAHGGQVILSSATRAAVEEHLPSGVRLRDLGGHRLKDLEGEERLYQLVIEGLPAEFPPPRSLEMSVSNLPQQLTTFFGRENELAEAKRLLASTRLLTLTGPGGTGKTRLAIRIAQEVAGDFPDGVYFVPLAALRESELVLPAIATTYGIQEGEDLRGRLIAAIGSKRQLCVLDNFEQLLPAARELGDLLSETPRLKVLVTSRSLLGVYGEREYNVPPLGLPDPDRLPSVTELERFEAVALFVDRARDARPDFALTQQNARAVAEIAVQLEGLPLAIELAAARVKMLPLDQLHRRLTDRLAFLGTARGSGDATNRQRTLRETIQWSYDLLTTEECALFSRLGVFRGGAPLSLAARVLKVDDELDLLEQLGSLVDKSILRRVDDPDEVRIDMLETLREFALDRLEARFETEEFQQRHATVYAEWIEAAAPNLTGDDGGAWLDRVEQEHNNLRAALSWAIEHDPNGIAQRIMAAAWRFWQMRGHINEGRDRAEQVLAASTKVTDSRARALEAAGGLAYWQGDFPGARTHYQAWLDLEREAGDERGVADALYNLCFTYFVSREDPATGRRLAEEALEIYRRLGDEKGVASAVWALGGIELSEDDVSFASARAHHAEAVELMSKLGNRPMLAWAYFMSGGLETREGKYPAARDRIKQALRLFVELGDTSGYALALHAIARLEWTEGHHETAARLSAASEHLEAMTGARLRGWTTELWTKDFDLERIRNDPELAEAWADGATMGNDAAVELALSLG
jgi:predicted ATPase/class 3 adenylate cyclase